MEFYVHGGVKKMTIKFIQIMKINLNLPAKPIERRNIIHTGSAFVQRDK